MQQVSGQRLHIVQSTDWKDAVIKLLQPRSPYRPWRYGTQKRSEGDAVAYVLNTDPVSVLADVAHVESDGKRQRAAFDHSLLWPNLVELSTLAVMLDLETWAAIEWVFDGDDAASFEAALDKCRFSSYPENRFGHNTMAAARTLLRFSGRCDGCERGVDLCVADARDRVFVHTVDPYRRPSPARAPHECYRSDAVDWPAVVCRDCRDALSGGRFDTFLAFKFARHPACPECGAQRTQSTFYGMPANIANIPPWWHAGGCCRKAEEWCCGACYHIW